MPFSWGFLQKIYTYLPGNLAAEKEPSAISVGGGLSRGPQISFLISNWKHCNFSSASSVVAEHARIVSLKSKTETSFIFTGSVECEHDVLETKSTNVTLSVNSSLASNPPNVAKVVPNTKR